MNADAKLTNRESEFTELAAWGATKKDIAKRCFVSVRTVENTFRSVFRKTGVTKVNELSAWWFCVQYNISFDFSPLKKVAMIFVFFAMLVPHEGRANNDMILYRSRQTQSRTLTIRSRTATARRRFGTEAYYLFAA